MTLTIERLREVLRYDPATGNWNRVTSGEIAGYISRGYRYVGVDGKKYRSGRLAWFYMTGEWPKNQIDHADRNPENDRWRNLREADSSEQGANRSLRSDNTTGVKGVSFEYGKWRSQIYVHGKKVSLGCYNSIEEAAAAYVVAADKHFGKFANPEISESQTKVAA